jgi:hypothetical protein
VPVAVGLLELESMVALGPHIRYDHVDGMDATHYPTRNVSDTGWQHRNWMDATLDESAGERTQADSADSPATAS